jgi:hypothetical protein
MPLARRFTATFNFIATESLQRHCYLAHTLVRTALAVNCWRCMLLEILAINVN